MKPHLVHIFPAFAGGGPEVRTAAIINWSSDHLRHTVLSLNQDTSGAQMLADPCHNLCLPVPDRSLRAVARQLRKLMPSLVLTYGWGGTDAIAAARLAGYRRVLHTEDGFLDDEVVRQKPARQLARLALFKIAAGVVVPSQTLQQIARQTWKVAQSRLRFIPNGVDTERFQPVDAARQQHARALLSLPVDAMIIGTVGALRPEKNQLRLVRAFVQVAAKCPQTHLLIVGDGPLREPMQQLLENANLSARATFAGKVTNSEQYLAAMDIFALPSDTEQMSLALLEAMAAGVPVVGTDVGDTKSVVCEQNRPSIVPACSDSVFADAICNLVADESSRRTIAESNRRRCLAEFSIDRMLHRYVALYNEHLAV